MRIVHEVDGVMQSSAGTKGPYALPTAEQKRGALASDFPVSCFACSDPNYTQPWQPEDEAIYIEGSAYHVRATLLAFLKMIDSSAEQMIKDGVLAPDWLEQCKKRTQSCKKT